MSARVCAEEGCGAHLAQHNPSRHCAVHQRLSSVQTSHPDTRMPDWAAEAPCAQTPVNYWFHDDVSAAAPFPTEVYEHRAFNEQGRYEVVAGMKLCGTCPFQVACLERAFALERRDRQELADEHMAEADRRYGVYGGIPGRIRERYARDPDRITKCLNWYLDVARERRWFTTEQEVCA